MEVSTTSSVSQRTLTTCSICDEHKQHDDYLPSSEFPTTCTKHGPDICRNCMSNSLTEAIKNKPLDRVGCPECAAAWDRDLLKRLASKEDFDRYEKKEVLKELQAMAGFQRCLLPGCEAGQFHEKESNEPIFTCHECRFKSCYVHQVPWHEGMTCEEYDKPRDMDEKTRIRIAAEEAEFEQEWGRHSKSCPNPVCKALIYKDEGCNHMLCELAALFLILEFCRFSLYWFSRWT